MPYSYNDTREERESAAERDLAEKLKLEPSLEESMAAIFVLMMIFGKESFLNGGQANQFSSFQPEVEEILRNHYIRVENVFKYQLRDSISSYLDQDLAFTNASKEINDELRRYREEQSTISSNQIIDTINKDYQKYILAASIFYLQNNIQPTDEQIIDKANELFADTIPYRAERIAVTETEGAAENSKFSEVVVLSSILATINILLGKPQLTSEEIEEILATGREIDIGYAQSIIGNEYMVVKYWVGILDDRIRDWHLEADGQQRALDEYFIVMGQQLMYPRDTSRGATADNVCNCRCSAVYRVSFINI